MPGLYNKQFLSSDTIFPNIPAEHDKCQAKEQWKSPSFCPSPPNTQQSAGVSKYNNEKLCQPVNMNAMEEMIPTDAFRSLQANAPRQACGSCTGSTESEGDLAALVREFLENGSYVSDMNDGSDSDSGLPSPTKLCEDLQVLMSSAAPNEKHILALLKKIVKSIDAQQDLACLDKCNECTGSCLREIVVNHFRSMGYNAAVCKVKWPNSQKLIGGDYEYVDILLDGDGLVEEGRVIIDLDFQSQFEIARPTQHYLRALNMLPITFVGFSAKLKSILNIMSEAAHHSLKHNSMHVPPWRTLDYMCAKWCFPCERLTDATGPAHRSFSNVCGGKHCWGLLRRMRAGLLGDSERGASLAFNMSKRTSISLLRIKPN